MLFFKTQCQTSLQTAQVLACIFRLIGPLKIVNFQSRTETEGWGLKFPAFIFPSLRKTFHLMPGLIRAGLAERRALVFLNNTCLRDIQQTLTKQRGLVSCWHGSDREFTLHAQGAASKYNAAQAAQELEEKVKQQVLGCPPASGASWSAFWSSRIQHFGEGGFATLILSCSLYGRTGPSQQPNSILIRSHAKKLCSYPGWAIERWWWMPKVEALSQVFYRFLPNTYSKKKQAEMMREIRQRVTRPWQVLGSYLYCLWEGRGGKQKKHKGKKPHGPSTKNLRTSSPAWYMGWCAAAV